MKKDYYGILKISRKATPENIKKAYRRAAKRHHPDISPKDEEKFKEIQAAYETLSDPEKKAQYDQEISSRPHSHERPYYPPEPFTHFFDLFGGIDLLFSDPWDFSSDAFPGHSVSRNQESRQYYLEITLTPKEAEKGCRIPLSVPIMKDCSRCRGTGRMKGLICGLCRGSGSIRFEEKISLIIPSDVGDGDIMRVPVKGFGALATDLYIVLRVSR